VVGRITADAPASITILDGSDVRATPGVNLDDRLRDVPGFSLFRRSSSVVAHPTTQGVSLRGIGSTGASRTLVLWDGFPVNDPFGGWVQWSRFAPEDIDRIEISRGASTSVFGDRAMGGAVALFSRQPEPLHLTASYSGGNAGTHEAGAGFAHLGSRWSASAQGRAFATDGYYVISEGIRGTADRRAGADFVAGNSRLDYLGAASRLFLKFDMLAERRRNGTPIQQNSTSLGSLSAHYSLARGTNTFSVLASHTREEFRSAFSAIAADRNSERPTFRQSVPAESAGGAAYWNRHGSRWDVLAGADVNHVEGYSKDTLFPSGLRVGGGTLLQHGAFVQTDVGAGPVKFHLGARHDFTGGDRQFFSPSAGVSAGRGRLRVRSSVYRAFRAPTLNELFREFRVGNAVTRANDVLRPERLFGAEAGVDYSGERSHMSFTLYRNSLSDLITNVTLTSSPSLIVRQRRNAASALARGVEMHADHRWRNWFGDASYLYADSRFSTGERLPQVPSHQGSARLGWQRGATFVSAGLRSYSLQFEDELNRFLLPGFGAVQVAVRRQINAPLSAFASVENLFDREYLTGFTPTPTVGAPRLWRLGLRWEGRVR
jgi:outer membrane cobalamin receptor